MNDAQLLKHLALNGNCNGSDTDLFFEPDNSRGMTTKNLRVLRKICGSCEVKPQCLDYAMRHDVLGFWGGTSHSERTTYRRQNGLKAEPVSFNLYVPRFKKPGEEEAMWRYIDSRSTCKNGHTIDNPEDVQVRYKDDRIDFACRHCSRDNTKRSRKKVSALSTEPDGGYW